MVTQDPYTQDSVLDQESRAKRINRILATKQLLTVCMFVLSLDEARGVINTVANRHRTRVIVITDHEHVFEPESEFKNLSPRVSILMPHSLRHRKWIIVNKEEVVHGECLMLHELNMELN